MNISKFVLLLMMAAVGGIWLLVAHERSESTSPRIPASIAAVTRPSADTTQSSSVSYVPASDSTRPDLTVARATGPARAGSPAAMRDLSQALKLCAILRASDDEAIVAKELQLAEGYKRFLKDTGGKYNPEALEEEVARKTEKQLQIKSVCSSISKDDASSWLDWLESAAAAGDSNAKLEFGSAVLARTADVNSMFEDLAETARQKQRAFEFLREVADSGNCTVSNQMEILAPTPSMAYAYSLVSFEHNKTQEGVTNAQIAAENIAFMQRQVDMKAVGLTTTEKAAARTYSQAVLKKCRP